jgi:hypothetical protein
MAYTLGQAAKATGMSKPSIAAAIKKGRISASKDDFGRYAIDPAELHRVYPPADQTTENLPVPPDKTSHENSDRIRELEGRLSALERLLKEVSESRALAREETAEWKREAAHWRNLIPAAHPPEIKSAPARAANHGSFWEGIQFWKARSA